MTIQKKREADMELWVVFEEDKRIPYSVYVDRSQETKQ